MSPGVSGVSALAVLPFGGGTWWDPNNEGLCVWGAWQPLGAASFADSLTDLSGNGNDAADPGGGGTPGWTAAQGWTFDGIGNYLTTTFRPQDDQSQSAVVRFSNVTNNGMLFGNRTAGVSRYFHVRPDNGAGAVSYGNGGGVVAAPALLAGILGIAGDRAYRNGVAEGAALAAYDGATAWATLIGARENAGVIDQYCACRIQTIAYYDCMLTAAQMKAIADATAALV